MKKVALLFTILCASALNGMEDWTALPQDIRYVIINTALKTSNNLNEAITAIKNLSVLQGAQFDKLFGNQKYFTKLVHILANKYNVSPAYVANQFKIPAAQKYVELMNALADAITDRREKEVSQLIADGADVNTYYMGNKIWRLAIAKPNILKILLQAGAQISQEDIDYLSDIIKSSEITPMTIEKRKSLSLLKEAMQKQQQQ